MPEEPDCEGGLGAPAVVVGPAVGRRQVDRREDDGAVPGRQAGPAWGSRGNPRWLGPLCWRVGHICCMDYDVPSPAVMLVAGQCNTSGDWGHLIGGWSTFAAWTVMD